MTDSSNVADGNAPLVFISHDSRDADLAEAFSRLLRSVSAGMVKAFRSSDKSGNEGIEFGDEWYKSLMSRLECASDVVCLLTERSLGRPWILYEAGVAKGKLGTPVHGLALGIPLSRASTGPFYQFQNSDDTEESLTKLALQLCRRVPQLEPDEGVVRNQVQAFKRQCDELLAKQAPSPKPPPREATDDRAIAKVLEEMKALLRDLPSRIEKQVTDGPRDRPIRSRVASLRVEYCGHLLSRYRDDPILILVLASLLRDEFPWVYELGLEAYRAALSGRASETTKPLTRFLAEMQMLARDLRLLDPEVTADRLIIIDGGVSVLEKLILSAESASRSRPTPSQRGG